MHDTLYVWEALGIGFTSLREQFDTSTAVGRVLLNLLAAVAEFEREQISAMVHQAIRLQAGVRPGAGADNADALRFGTVKAWQLAELRRTLAELIVAKR